MLDFYPTISSPLSTPFAPKSITINPELDNEFKPQIQLPPGHLHLIEV